MHERSESCGIFVYYEGVNVVRDRKWKNGAAERAREPKVRSWAKPLGVVDLEAIALLAELETMPWVYDDGDDDGTYGGDEGLGLSIVPLRRTRSSRG